MKELASRIDHTLLKPTATLEEIKQVCNEAIENNFKAVCIPPYYVSQAKDFLEGRQVHLATVIGFPMGYQRPVMKLDEANDAMRGGVDEVDVVMNLAAFFSGNTTDVLKEIKGIVQFAHHRNRLVKWIIETGLLSENQIKHACDLAAKAEVDFVKTSTGFNGAGATIEVVELLRKILPQKIKIKASGGIKTQVQAIALINAGADRIGTSSSLQIINADNQRSE